VNQVIPGWTEALQLMNEGSKYTLIIPPDLAYGPQGNQRIPGNSVLLFEVELLEVLSDTPEIQIQ
jgi:FKBP-type peptidyl-prolyl cis-trans isomerase